MGTILTRKRQIAAKIEVSEGTAETLAAVDGGLLAIDPKWEPDVKLFPRAVVSDTFSKFRQLPGQQLASVKFQAEVKGSGTVDLPPAIGKYLKACGFAETINATVSVVYKPVTNAVPSLTMALFSGDDAGSGLKKLIRGVRGTVKFSVRTGEPMIAEFNFMGVVAAPTDNAPLVGVNYDNTTEPPVMLSSAFSVAGFSAKILALELDLANVVAMRDDPSTAEGYFSALITDRRPIGSFDPEETLVADHDWFGRFKAGTEGALSFNLGSVAGNRVAVSCPKTQYTKLAESERNGLASLDVDLALNRDADLGNDEMVLTFS